MNLKLEFNCFFLMQNSHLFAKKSFHTFAKEKSKISTLNIFKNVIINRFIYEIKQRIKQRKFCYIFVSLNINSLQLFISN